MTIAPTQELTERWPGLDVVPTGPRSRIAARVARRLFVAAVSRLDVTVHVGDETFGRGGPTATVHRPAEFFARLGRDQLIGFGEAYLTGAWGTQRPSELGEFLAVLAAEMPQLVPAPLQKLRSLVVSRPPGQAPRQPEEHPRQHRSPLRPLQRPLRAVPRPDAQLLRGAVRRRSRAGDPRRPRDRPGPQDRAAPRPGRCRCGHPGARDRHRLGRAGASGPRAAEPASTRSRSPRSSAAWRRIGWRPPGCRTWSRSSCATTAPSPGSTTRSCRSR